MGGLLWPAVCSAQIAKQRLGHSRRVRAHRLHGLRPHARGHPGGAQTIATALGVTGATFLALSTAVLKTRKDFSFMGGVLFASMVLAVVPGLAAISFELSALGLAVSGMVALLSVGLFVSVFNLFVSLLNSWASAASTDPVLRSNASLRWCPMPCC